MQHGTEYLPTYHDLHDCIHALANGSPNRCGRPHGRRPPAPSHDRRPACRALVARTAHRPHPAAHGNRNVSLDRPGGRRKTPDQAETQNESHYQKAEQAETASKAQAIWKAAIPAPADHPYLVRKGVEPTSTLREINVQQAVQILGYRLQTKDVPLQGRLLVAPIMRSGVLSTVELIDELPRGTLTLLAGQPGTGKTTIAMAVASPTAEIACGKEIDEYCFDSCSRSSHKGYSQIHPFFRPHLPPKPPPTCPTAPGASGMDGLFIDQSACKAYGTCGNSYQNWNSLVCCKTSTTPHPRAWHIWPLRPCHRTKISPEMQAGLFGPAAIVVRSESAHATDPVAWLTQKPACRFFRGFYDRAFIQRIDYKPYCIRV